MINKHKTKMKEIIAIYAIIPILFLFFFHKKVSGAHVNYEFILLIISLFVKKIRENIFTKNYLTSSLIITVILTGVSFRSWQGEGIVFVLTLVMFFIITRGLIGLLLLLKESLEIKDGFDSLKPRQAFIEVFVAVFISLVAFWLYRYYPSGISPDIIYQREQVLGNLPFTDIHAPFHTLIIMGFNSIRDSNNIIVLSNIFLISLMAALFADYFYKKGIDVKWLIVLYVIFTFTKMTIYYMYPYKDIPYTLVLGMVTYLLMRIMDGAETKIVHSIVFGMLLTLCWYLRYNGIICTAFVSIYLIYMFIKKRLVKQLIAFILSFAILSVGIHFILYDVMKCEHVENGFSVQVFGSGISSVVAHDGNITQDQLNEVDEILGLEWINENYDEWATKKLIWEVETNDPNGFFKEPKNQVYNNFFVVGMGKHRSEVIKLYLSLFIKNPLICMKDFALNTYHIWGYENSFSNIFLLSILLLATFVFWKGKNSKAYWIVFVPVVANILSIAISTITKELRYLMPTTTLFVPLFLYVISAKSQMEDSVGKRKEIGL